MKTVRIALLILALGLPASAQTTPEPGCSSELGFLKGLFLGVSELTVAFACPQPQGGTATSTAHVIRVNLGAPGLTFETSGAGDTGAFPVGPSAIFDQKLTTAFLTHSKTQVAFNANLFTNCCCDYVSSKAPPEKTYLIGLEVSGGKVLSGVGAKPNPLDGSCGSTKAANYPFDYSLVVRGHSLRIERFVVAQAAPVEAAVTGSHLLVSGGRNVAPADDTGEFFGTNARTLVGLSGDDMILWIAAVDRSTSDGVTLAQAAQLMIQLGAATAINLDGGGSTSLAVEDMSGAPRLLNQPNDVPDPSNPHKVKCMVAVNGYCERFVGASFGIHALPLAPTAR